MSIRTLIEINHDCLTELAGRPLLFVDLLKLLAHAGNEAINRQLPRGIRVMCSRHHADDEKPELRAAAAALDQELFGHHWYVATGFTNDSLEVMVTKKLPKNVVPESYRGFSVKAVKSGRPRPARTA